MQNALYYGDNLAILRRYISSESVDLIYLDPPFNSDATYNVLFRSPTGNQASAQIRAFDDTWHWQEEARLAYEEVLSSGSPAAAIIRALRSFLGETDIMAYLCMMTVRLIEMHRVLKPTGSIYLHCDPTASHYLRVILDGIFLPQNFRNEVIWRRSNAHNKLSRQYGPIHDTILFYSKSDDMTFHPKWTKYTKQYIDSEFRYSDDRGRYALNNLTGPGKRFGDSGQPWRGYDPSSTGRHWAIPASIKEFIPDSAKHSPVQEQLDALNALGFIVFSKNGRPKYKQYFGRGIPYQDIWAFQPGTEGVLFEDVGGVDQDIKWLDSETERLGYPTQKPLGLLKRIIESSTDEGMVILDPFCGCGTAIHAAQMLNRNWIGIDITHLAIQVIEDRLEKHFRTLSLPKVVGRPYDLEAARDLARRDKYQFQWWATWLVGGRARGGERKGADRGVDGDIFFSMGRGKDGHGIISVKGGMNLGPQMIRDLKGTREREGADVAIFVCLEEPTPEMRREAAACESLTTPIGPVSRVQIYSIGELLLGTQIHLPPIYSTITAAEIARERKPVRTAKRPSPKQREMLFPVPGTYAAASDVPLLEAAEEAAAFDHERRQVTRRRRKS